jgi:transposase
MIGSTSLTAGGTNHSVQIWMAAAPVDMRKSFDGLAEHVRAFLGHDPLCGHMFVFRNRTGERLKILWWDRNGLVLYYKRLEKGTFRFPSADPSTALSTDPSTGQKCLTLDGNQLLHLLAGSQIVQRAAAAE